jgi:hypothetical protein
MKFWALTVSLIPMAQDLFYEQHREKDSALIPRALQQSAESDPTGRPLRLGRIVADGNLNLIGLYGKRETAHLYDENFRRRDQPSYPPRVWLWDHAEQALLVQVDTRIFADAEAAARQFEALLTSTLASEQLEARIYPKVGEEQFWSAVESFAQISQITFEYATPNMFGQTKAEMTAFLKEVRDSTNATVVSTTLVNDEGNIHPKPDGLIARTLDWIKDGGGKWLIKGRVRPGARPTTRKSGKQATIYFYPDESIRLDTQGYTAAEISEIIQMWRSAYTFRATNTAR